MARLVPLDHGTGDTRIRHPQAEVQVLLLLRPEPENGRCQDQHDLRAGQMAAARRGDRLYRGGNAHVRRVAGITPHTHTHTYTHRCTHSPVVLGTRMVLLSLSVCGNLHGICTAMDQLRDCLRG